RSRPPALCFVYRQSPDYLVASDFRDVLLTPGVVSMTDPPTTLSGMINLKIDTAGRLMYFQAIPPEKNSQPALPGTPDWIALFKCADLDMSEFQSGTPQWNSLANSDARAAWTGVWPGSARPLRVEAASYRGKPVFFGLIGEWTLPPRMTAPPT